MKTKDILKLLLEFTICIFGFIGIVLSLLCGYEVHIEIKPIKTTNNGNESKKI
jgi:hypothetical protein